MPSLKDESGSALVYTFVCLVVLSFILMGMLQTAAMAYRSAKFQENRQRAFSAAESGLAMGLAVMSGGTALERREYDVDPPSIDLAADNWLGGGSGSAPVSACLPTGASYKVWLSAQDRGGQSTLTSRGTCGPSSRAVEVTVREPRIVPANATIAAAAKSPGSAVHLKGFAMVVGDTRVESARVNSVELEPFLGFGSLMDLQGDLIVGKGARKSDFVRKLTGIIKEKNIKVADEERTYPAVIAPDSLPVRKDGIRKKDVYRHTISESGDYPFIELNGVNELRFATGDSGDPAKDDIEVRVRGNFEMKGISSITISGRGKVRLYADQDIENLGISFVLGLLDGRPDPSRLSIYCSGKRVNMVKGFELGGFLPITLPGVGITSCMVYAPEAKVTYESFAAHLGSIVCDTIKSDGVNVFISEEQWRRNPFEPEGRTPKVVPGSWRERH